MDRQKRARCEVVRGRARVGAGDRTLLKMNDQGLPALRGPDEAHHGPGRTSEAPAEAVALLLSPVVVAA